MPFSGHTDGVCSVAFSPDGSHVVSGSSDNIIKLWDAETSNIHHAVAGHSKTVKSVVFSPDGSCIASGSSDNTIKIWDIETANNLHTFFGHIEGVWAVAADKMRLVSGSHDRTIKVGCMQLYRRVKY